VRLQRGQVPGWGPAVPLVPRHRLHSCRACTSRSRRRPETAQPAGSGSTAAAAGGADRASSAASPLTRMPAAPCHSYCRLAGRRRPQTHSYLAGCWLYPGRRRTLARPGGRRLDTAVEHLHGGSLLLLAEEASAGHRTKTKRALASVRADSKMPSHSILVHVRRQQPAAAP
jgi:hypothetical protein